MRFLRRLTGWGLALLFIAILPCSLWTFNTQRIVLDGQTYKTVFANEGFYTDLAPRVLPALLKELGPTTSATGITLLDAIDHLAPQDWETIAPQLVPKEWVSREVEQNLDAFLAWLDGTANLDIVFNTGLLRTRLASAPGEAAVTRIGELLPACAPDQETQFGQFVDSAEAPPVAFPYCRPADPALQRELAGLLNTARLAALDSLPEQLDVVEEMRTVSQEATTPDGKPVPANIFSDAELNRFRSTIRLWRQLLALTLMIPAALLSLTVIVVVRSSKTFFRWMGWSLMAGSVLTLLPLFLLPFIVQDFNFEHQIEQGFATGGALIAEVMGGHMVRLLIGAFTWPILIQSAILIAIGFAFAVVSVLLRDPDAPPMPQTVLAYVTPTGEVTPILVPDSTPTPSGQGTRAAPPDRRQESP
jgi:hypothetical protein